MFHTAKHIQRNKKNKKGELNVKTNFFNYFICFTDTPPQTPPNMKFNTANSTTAGNYTDHKCVT